MIPTQVCLLGDIERINHNDAIHVGLASLLDISGKYNDI